MKKIFLLLIALFFTLFIMCEKQNCPECEPGIIDTTIVLDTIIYCYDCAECDTVLIADSCYTVESDCYVGQYGNVIFHNVDSSWTDCTIILEWSDLNNDSVTFYSTYEFLEKPAGVLKVEAFWVDTNYNQYWIEGRVDVVTCKLLNVYLDWTGEIWGENFNQVIKNKK